MDLQIALIAFGIAIIFVVYWLSVRREKLNSMAEGERDNDVHSDAPGISKPSLTGFFSHKTSEEEEAHPQFTLSAHESEQDENTQLAPQFALDESEADEDRVMPQFLYEEDIHDDMQAAKLTVDTDDEKQVNEGNSLLLKTREEEQISELHEKKPTEYDTQTFTATQDSSDVVDELEQTAKLLKIEEDMPQSEAVKQHQMDASANNITDKDVDLSDNDDAMLARKDNMSRNNISGQQNTKTELQQPQPSAAVKVEEKSGFHYEAPEGFDKLSQIDYWVKLEGRRDVGRETIMGLFRQHANEFAAPVRLYGQRSHDNIWADVEQEAEDTRFTNLVVTMQLVTAIYAADEIQLRQFSEMVEALSVKTGRAFRFMAPIDSALHQAKALAAFRAQFDSVYLVNIRPLESGQFGGAAVDRCATQLGLEKGLHHYVRYKLIGRQKAKVYSVANLSDSGEFDFTDIGVDIIKGVTFFTQPAVNKSPAAIYAEMVDAAKSFSSRIKGNITSPVGTDLSVDEIEKMRRKIDQMTKQMQGFGIAPGSEEAIRLFSA